MSRQYWIRSGQQVRGPFNAAQVKKLADAGKLTGRHEISTDQSEWRSADQVGGLSLGETTTENSAPPEGLAEVATSDGTKVALGVLLLVGVGLLVAGACFVKLGILSGLVFTLIFVLTAGLGYPVACLGRDVSIIYVLIMSVVFVMLLGDSPVQFGATISSLASFAAGLVPGALVVLAWMLISKGLGHDNAVADLARLNPSRFSSSPVSSRELKQAMMATADGVSVDRPKRVRLRLDPDDLDRVDDSLGETIEQEARRSAPGVAVSVLVHAVLLAAFWIWRIQLPVDSYSELELGWTLMAAPEETKVTPDNPPDLDLQLTPMKPREAEKPEEKPLQPLSSVPKQVVPVKPVNVGGMFEHRQGDHRQQILNDQSKNVKSVEAALTMGLGWLMRQQESDGRWRWDGDFPDSCDWPNLYTDTGATAMTLLVFLGNGHSHQQAKDKAMQEVIAKGLKWLMDQQKKNGNGDFHDRAQEYGRQPAFYAHSQATIVMCEAFALTNDREMFKAAQQGVAFLLKSQQPDQGGWRYQTQDQRTEGDLSVTGWALMALHSARAIGIGVPDEPFQRASKFLNSVQEKDGAHYRYQPSDDWPVTRAMTAEGLLCRQYLGWPKDQPQLLEGINLLWDEDSPPGWSDPRRNVYEWYFTGQVLHNIHDERWDAWYEAVQQELLRTQLTAGRDFRGSWHPAKPEGVDDRERGPRYDRADNMGRLYMTTMCLLILETPIRHQPIY